MDLLGFIVVDKLEIPIVGVHLCGGIINLVGLVDSPFPGCKGRPVIYGHDMQNICQVPSELEIAPQTGDGVNMRVDIPLMIEEVR